VEWLNDLLASRTLLLAAGIGSAVMFFGTLLAIPRLVARLPVAYFVGERRPTRPDPKYPFLSFATRLLRNVLGIGFILAGLAMLVLPGQGILTILVGVAMTDFPGRRRIERRLVAQKHVRKSLQWLRERAGVEPLVFDD